MIKALPGIENCKFSPIIADVKDFTLPVQYTEKYVALHPIRELIHTMSQDLDDRYQTSSASQDRERQLQSYFEAPQKGQGTS